MRILTALVRQRHQAARCYAAAAELAVQQDSPFLKFANPEPQTFNHLQALGQIPETKASTQTEAWQAVLTVHTPGGLLPWSNIRTLLECQTCARSGNVACIPVTVGSCDSFGCLLQLSSAEQRWQQQRWLSLETLHLHAGDFTPKWLASSFRDDPLCGDSLCGRLD